MSSTLCLNKTTVQNLKLKFRLIEFSSCCGRVRTQFTTNLSEQDRAKTFLHFHDLKPSAGAVKAFTEPNQCEWMISKQCAPIFTSIFPNKIQNQTIQSFFEFLQKGVWRKQWCVFSWTLLTSYSFVMASFSFISKLPYAADLFCLFWSLYLSPTLPGSIRKVWAPISYNKSKLRKKYSWTIYLLHYGPLSSISW